MTAQHQTRRIAFLAVVLAMASAANAQDSGAVERGNTKFQRTCAPCHGPGPGHEGRAALPGTEALQIKYKGSLPALLEARTDLNYEAIKTFVRHGTMSMPPFRATEVTDAEIKDIAAYLASPASKANARASGTQR